MTGHPAVEILALWAGADLDEDVMAEVGLHVESCGQCRNYVDEIRRTEEVLAGFLEQPSEADLLHLRSGLARSIEKRRRAARWGWSLAAAAAALVLMFAGFTHRRAPAPTLAERTLQLPAFPASMHLALEIPESKQVRTARAQRPKPKQEAGLRAVNFVPGADGSTQLRLTTADPNVIILLPQQTERTVEP